MTLEYLISTVFKVITFKLFSFLSCEQFKEPNRTYKMFSLAEPKFSSRKVLEFYIRKCLMSATGFSRILGEHKSCSKSSGDQLD